MAENNVHEYSDCDTCGGFKGREVRGFKVDGYLVKVHDERQSVFGTAWYNLNHATIRLGVKRFQVVTWFGSMGNRKFEGQPVKGGCTCPVCSAKMETDFYVGKEKIVKDLGSPAYRRVVLRSEFDENGEPNFIDGGGGKVE